MRWTGVFAYLSAAVVAILLLSRWLDWTGWLLVISIVLALPLAIIGVWILVASATGFGESPFGRVVDVLGLLTGAGLGCISIATWWGAEDLAKTIAAGAAVAYCLWATGLGWALWRYRRPGQALRSATSAYPG